MKTKQFTIRMDSDFYDELLEIAEKEDRSVSQQTAYFIKRGKAVWESEQKVIKNSEQTVESAV